MISRYLANRWPVNLLCTCHPLYDPRTPAKVFQEIRQAKFAASLPISQALWIYHHPPCQAINPISPQPCKSCRTETRSVPRSTESAHQVQGHDGRIQTLKTSTSGLRALSVRMNFMAPYNSEHMVSLSKNDNKEGRSRNAPVSGRRAPTASVWARIAYMQQEKMSDLATQWLAEFCQLFQLHDKRWTNPRAQQERMHQLENKLDQLIQCLRSAIH